MRRAPRQERGQRDRRAAIRRRDATLRDGLAFPNYFTAWQDGRPLDPETPGYAKALLDQLSWWAATLRAGRAATPYPA